MQNERPGIMQRLKAFMGGHQLAFPFDMPGQRSATSFMGMPQPPAYPTDVAGLIPYTRRSELVYACIEKKSEAVCDPEIVVERSTKDGEWEREKDHPFVALMNRPNPYEDGSSFRRSWIASQDFADCFYYEVVRNSAGVPVELYPLNPANIYPQYRIKEGGGGYELLFYYYTFAGVQLKLLPDDVKVYRRHGLTSIYAGVSPVAAALGAIDAAASGLDYVRSFFLNDGTPSGLLKIKGRKMSEEEANTLQAKWVGKFGLGGAQYRGIAVLDEQADFQAIGTKIAEAGLTDLEEITESQICGVLGVPPVLVYAYVGLKYMHTRASAKEAQKDFWSNTISPNMKAWRSYLTWFMLPEFETVADIMAGKVRVNWDMTQVEALQEDVDGIHARARNDYTAGLTTLDEGRARIGMPPASDAALGAAYIALPIGDALGSGPPQMTFGKSMNGNGHNGHKNGHAARLEKKTFEYDGLILGREPTELEKTVLDLKTIISGNASDADKLKAILLDLRDVLIDDAESAAADLSADELADLTLSAPDSFTKEIEAVLAASSGRGRASIISELRKQGIAVDAGKVTIDTAEATGLLADLTVSRSVNEIAARTTSAIATSGVLGIAKDQIAKNLAEVLREQSTAWTDRYAGGAVNAAMNEGRTETMGVLSDDIGGYEYSAVMDANTCDTCGESDGETAKNIEELPDVPNPDCDGADRCRCIIIPLA